MENWHFVWLRARRPHELLLLQFFFWRVSDARANDIQSPPNNNDNNDASRFFTTQWRGWKSRICKEWEMCCNRPPIEPTPFVMETLAWNGQQSSKYIVNQKETKKKPSGMKCGGKKFDVLANRYGKTIAKYWLFCPSDTLIIPSPCTDTSPRAWKVQDMMANR